MPETGLSERNFKLFESRARLAVYFIKAFVIGTFISAIPVHVFAIVLGFRTNGISIARLTSNIISAIVFSFWLDSALAYSYICGQYFLSVTYIKLRFEQINEAIKKIVLDLKFKRYLNESSLEDIINEHLLTTQLMSRANRFIRFVLFCFGVLSPPMIGMLIYLIIYGDIDVYFRYGITGCCSNVILMVLVSSSFASKVATKAKGSYVSLNSIQARVGHEQINKDLQRQISLTIKAINSDRLPIAFYCYDIYAFTPQAFFDFIVSSVAFFVLVISL